MKLINKLITKTAIYKHLKDLYEQALKDCEELQGQNEVYWKEIEFLRSIQESTEKSTDKLIAENFKLKELTKKSKVAKENKELKEQIEVYKIENKGQAEGLKKQKEEFYKKENALNRNKRELEIINTELLNENIDLKNQLDNNWNVCVERCNKYMKKKYNKILTYVRKLDKKDENVKEIKRLIKEVLG